MSEPTPADVAQEKTASKADAARIAIGLAIALVVATLAALGVQGDSLGRIVRNHPWLVSITFGLVILGLVLPLFNFRASAVWRRKLDFASLALVCVGSILAIVLASISYQDREIPGLVVTPDWSDSTTGGASFSISASALSLKTDEDLFLRVTGVKGLSPSEFRELCRTDHLPDKQELKTQQVLWWGASGPTSTGEATLKVDVSANASDYDYLCFYAALRNRPDPTAHRSVWAFVDMSQVTPNPTTTPNPEQDDQSP